MRTTQSARSTETTVQHNGSTTGAQKSVTDTTYTPAWVVMKPTLMIENTARVRSKCTTVCQHRSVNEGLILSQGARPKAWQSIHEVSRVVVCFYVIFDYLYSIPLSSSRAFSSRLRPQRRKEGAKLPSLSLVATLKCPRHWMLRLNVQSPHQLCCHCTRVRCTDFPQPKPCYVFQIPRGCKLEYLMANIEAPSLRVSPQDVVDNRKELWL